MNVPAYIAIAISLASLTLAILSFRYSRRRDHWREEAARTIATLNFSDRLDEAASKSHAPFDYPREALRSLRELVALCDSRAVKEELLFTAGRLPIETLENRVSKFLRGMDSGRLFKEDWDLVSNVQKRLERWK